MQVSSLIFHLANSAARIPNAGYRPQADDARMVLVQGDLRELADFTQQIYLGMRRYHEWYQEKRGAKVRKLQPKREAAASLTSSSISPDSVTP
jgi:hypothetical protein